MTIQKINLTKIILQALRLPLLLFVLGLGISNLGLIVNTNPYWLKSVSVAAVAGHVFMAVSWVLFIYAVMAAVIQMYQQTVDCAAHRTLSHLLDVIQTALKFLFVFFAFRAIVSVLDINPSDVDIIRKVTTIFIIASIAWLSLQVISTLEVVAYDKYTQHHASRDGVSNYTRIHLIRNILVVLVFVVALAASLMVFDNVRNIGISLLASAGFLTAILGLASQQSLGALFSGIQFAFAQPFQIGDTITVENQTGTIEEITLLYVKMKTTNSQQYTLPISYFLQKPFYNWSFYQEGIEGEIKQSISANFPLKLIRDELNKIADDSSAGIKKIRAINVSGFNDSDIE
jgi:small-conductance mechanosensitive channel